MSAGTVEAPAFAAFAQRMLRAFARRSQGDPEALALLVALSDEVDAAIADGINGCVAAGYSYAEIASRLGCSRQAVHQRIRRQRGIDTGQAPLGRP